MYGVLATQAGPNWCWTELNYFNFIHTESSSVLTVLFSSLLHNDRQNPNAIQMKVWGSQGWTPSKQTKTVRHFYFKSTAVVYQQGLYSLMLSYLRCYLLQFLVLLWKKNKTIFKSQLFHCFEISLPKSESLHLFSKQSVLSCGSHASKLVHIVSTSVFKDKWKIKGFLIWDRFTFLLTASFPVSFPYLSSSSS